MTLPPAVLWRATRAYSLPASVVPVLLGTVLAFRGDGGPAQRHFDGTLFLVVLLGSILAHFGANVLNDYFDFILGVDTRPEHGSGVLTGGHMTAREILVFGLMLLVGAADRAESFNGAGFQWSPEGRLTFLTYARTHRFNGAGFQWSPEGVGIFAGGIIQDALQWSRVPMESGTNGTGKFFVLREELQWSRVPMESGSVPDAREGGGTRRASMEPGSNGVRKL